MLDEMVFQSSVRELAVRDSDLARVIEMYGAPPLWVREPGFPSLVYIILEQQVSLASARAAFQRLRGAAGPLTPARFLKLSDTQLRQIGFSRQKTLYARLLAESLVKRHLDLNDLHDLSDDAARKFLIALKGIGGWTADIYLLSALRRPDIWPVGDCQREITDGPNVRTAQCGKQIDVRGPAANAFERDEEFACSVVGKIVKVIEIEMPLDERFGEQTCVESFLTAEADLPELR